MLRKIRERMQSEESGFSLIELLVVSLIIGILTAIAIPAFLGQREKGQDAAAKSAVRNAQSAAEAYFTERRSYAGMDRPALQSIEPTIPDSLTVTNVTATGPSAGYTLTATSETTGTFSITRSGATVTRACGPSDRASKGGCKDGTW